MGIFQFLMAFYFTFNFMYSVKAFGIVAKLYFIILPVILLLIPVFYLYILSVTTPGFSFRKSYLFHFIPSLLIAGLNTPYLFAPGTEKLNFISNGYSMLNPNLYSYLMLIYVIGIVIIFAFQLVFYTFRAVKLYKKHKSYIENRFSYTENINLDWILVLIISFAFFFIFNDILYLVGFRQHFFAQMIYNIAMLMITLYAGYRGLLQQELNDNLKKQILIAPSKPFPSKVSTGFETKASINDYSSESIENPEAPKSEKADIVKKYSGSALTDDQKKVLITKLQVLIQEEKIFINDKLSIEDIAIKLDTNSKYISQIINETFNKNFFNYINSYRIEEAKRLLLSEENDKYSILGIAQSVGFVSKSTFNAAFKRITGMTPSEFKTKMG